MNKSVILIQILISSSLPNPIDRTSSDVSVSEVEDDSQVTRPIAHVAVNGDDGDALVSKTVDNIISSSEIIKVNNVDKIIDDKLYSQALEEEDKQAVEIKSTGTTHEAETKSVNGNLEPESKMDTSTQSLHAEEKKAAIESVTSSIEVDSTADYLENPADSVVEAKNAPEEESRSVKSELVKANDESNDGWDVLDDLIQTRRMIPELRGLKEERISEIIPGKAASKSAVPQENRKGVNAQIEEDNVRKGKDDIQIIRIPNVSRDPTNMPLYQQVQLPSYVVNPAKTNQDSSIYRIMDYPLGPATRRYLGLNPVDFKEHMHRNNYSRIPFPMMPSYNSAPLPQNPIDKSAYILSKLFDASERSTASRRRMSNNPTGLGVPKFLNINLPQLASSCGVTRACALFTI